MSYDKPMSYIARPAITFSPDVVANGTLVPDVADSYWLDQTHYVARYNVVDRNIPSTPVLIGVSGAWDPIGNYRLPTSPRRRC